MQGRLTDCIDLLVARESRAASLRRIWGEMVAFRRSALARRAVMALLLAFAIVVPVVAADTRPAAALDYAATVMADSPMHYWRMNCPVPHSSSSYVVDEVTGSDNLQCTDLGSGPSAVADADGSAAIAGGTVEHVIVNGEGAPDFTEELWFKSTSTTDPDAVLIGRPDGYGVSMRFLDGAVAASVDQLDGPNIVIESPETYLDEQWHYVAVLRLEGLLYLYVDAQLVAAKPLPEGIFDFYDGHTFSGSFPGGWPFSGEPTFDGYMDDLAYYTRGLQPGQVVSHYAAAGYTPPALPPISPHGRFGGDSIGAPHLAYCARCVGAPVDTSTGNFFHTFTDMTLPSRGPGIGFTRTYNSAPGESLSDSPFGYGWSFPYGMRVTADATTATVTQENGAELTFTYNSGTSAWDADPYVTSTLDDLGTTWKLTRNKTDISIFDKATGRLTTRQDLNGYETSLTYDGSGNLTTVTNDAGRSVTVAWSGSHISSISDPAGRSVTYSYDGSANLTDVVDVRGGHAQFTYDANHRLLTMRSPRFYGDTTTTPSPVVTNNYDGAGRVDVQTDELGRETTFSYTADGAGSLTVVTDAEGNETAHFYDASHFLRVKVAGYLSAAPATWLYDYDPTTAGITRVQDPRAKVTTMTYDADGNLLSQTDPLNHEASWTYNALNEPLTATDRNGIVTTNTYDSNGNLLTTSTPCTKPGTPPTSCGTQLTTYHYDDGSHPGDVTSVTDPRSQEWTNAYNADGTLQYRESPAIAAAPFSGAKMRTSYTYDALGRQISTVPGAGNKAGANPDVYRNATLVDDGGLPIVTTDSNGQPQFDTFTRPDSATIGSSETGKAWSISPSGTAWDINGRAAKLTTNASGNKNFATLPLYADGTFGITLKSTITGSSNNGFGILFRYQDANNFWSLRATPGASEWRLYKVVAGTATLVSPTGGVIPCCTAGQRVSVEAAGSALTVKINSETKWSGTDSALSTATTGGLFADRVGNPAATDFFAYKTGSGVNNYYDANGQLTKTTDGDGNTTAYDYDAAGQLTTMHRPDATTLGYGYDDVGNRTSYEDGNHNTTSWAYTDAANPHSPTSMTPPGLNATQYEYDRAGNLAVLTDASNRTTTYSYDDANRITDVAYSSSSTPSVTNVQYDNEGRRTSVTEDNGIGTSAWTYDSLGRVLTSKLGGSGSTVTYDYDLNGNTTSITYPGETYPVARCFDEANRLVKVVDWNTSGGCASSGPAGTFTYNFNSDVTTAAYGNGNSDVRSYDAAGNVTQLDTKKAGLSQGKLVYTYGAQSKLTSTNTTITGLTPTGSEYYRYDTRNQLCRQGPSSSTSCTTSGQQRYGYDDGDNITRRDTDTGTYTAQYQKFNSSNQVCWRAAGTTSSCSPNPAGATVYGYTAEGERASATDASTTINYGYDQKQRLVSVSSPSSTYTYMADDVRLSKTVSGTTTNFTYDAGANLLQQTSGASRVSWLYGPDGIPFARNATGTVAYMHHDQLGTIRFFSNAAGTLYAFFNADAYGNTVSESAAHPIRYAGAYRDAETGFYYLHHRYYDPTTAQFLTRDPIESTTLSAYSYVNGKPLNYRDPSGLDATYTVYVEQVDGQTTYVGMTSDFEQRALYWARHGRQIDAVLTDLNYAEARGVEQSFIGANGLEELDNQINSIARSNPNFESRLLRAKEIIEENPLALSEAVSCDQPHLALRQYYESVGLGDAIAAAEAQQALEAESRSIGEFIGNGGRLTHEL
jgi:RHS repeat-associated protein